MGIKCNFNDQISVSETELLLLSDVLSEHVFSYYTAAYIKHDNIITLLIGVTVSCKFYHRILRLKLYL